MRISFIITCIFEQTLYLCYNIRMAKAKVKTEYKLNQQVVYPSQGVGKITEIFEKEFKGVTNLYYRIYLEVSDMVVMVPVDHAAEIGIRAIVEKDAAQKALKMLGEDFEPITSDWKLRYQMNLDLLKKGSINDIATIVRCLYNRSKVKELPIQERKLYDSAKKLLEDEISISLGKTQKEVEALIHSKLEPEDAGTRVKHVVAQTDDDDDDDFDMMDDEVDTKRKKRDDDDDETESLDEAADEEEEDEGEEDFDN
jgi:CarD family transcriptional regulator